MGWKEWVFHHRERKQFNKECLKVMKNGTVARAFTAWRNRFHEEQLQKTLIKRCSDHLSHRKLKRHFKEWLSIYRRSKIDSRLFAAIKAKRSYLILTQSFTLWRRSFLERRATMSKAISIHQFFQMRYFFRVWNTEWKQSLVAKVSTLHCTFFLSDT